VGSASVALLERWKVWPAVQADAEAIQQVHVSQRGHFGAVRLCASELGVSCLGYVIENRCWTRALSELAQAHDNIQSVRGVTIASISDKADDCVTATLSSGDVLSAKLVLAVDGVNSRVRDLVGIGDTHVDYEQSALLTTVRLAGKHNACAYERFTPDGPLALLPRPNNTMSVVWCADVDTVVTLSKLSDSKLLSALQTHFGYRLGRFTAVGAKAVVPLMRREAASQVGERTVLLGNAARLLHPVAGQGFNLVLRDTAALLDLIGQCGGTRATDPGAAVVLNRFSAIRENDQQRVVQLTDNLARMFRGQNALAGHARGVVLNTLDAVGPLRSQFANTAMGYSG